MTTKNCWEINAPAVSGEIIDGEAIILHLPHGHYFSTEGSGALIWAGVEQRLPAAAIGRALAQHYNLDEEAAQAAVDTFLAKLAELDLVRPGVADATDGELAYPQASTAYGAPHIAVYTDMEDLLLLDPVHDVDAAGWPAAPVPGQV